MIDARANKDPGDIEKEGFSTGAFAVNPFNGEIVTKPNELWSENNKKLLVPTDYVLCANFSLQT